MIFFCRESRADVFAFCSSCSLQSHGGYGKATDVGFLRVDVFGTRWNTPTLAVNEDTSNRLIGMPVGGGGTTLFGADVAFQFREGVFAWEMLKLSYATSGTGATSVGSANNQTYSVHRGPLNIVEIGVPFFFVPGIQFVSSSSAFKVATNVDWGFAHAFTGVTMTGSDGAATTGNASSWSGYVRLNFAACLNVASGGDGQRSWTCLTASPNIIGWSGGGHTFDGISFGLRGEL